MVANLKTEEFVDWLRVASLASTSTYKWFTLRPKAPHFSTMSATTDSGKRYHNECTGLALETVNKHQQHADITLFGSCFCPFVQRAWVVFEYLGVPYKVGSIV
jgi:hypothetical protein